MNKDLLQKLAAVETRDREAAFEAGFMKAAQDFGLTEDEYKEFYAEGVKKLQSLKK